MRPDTGSYRSPKGGRRCTACGGKLRRHPDSKSMFCPGCDDQDGAITAGPSRHPGQVRMTEQDIRYHEYMLKPRRLRERIPLKPARGNCESCGGERTVKPLYAYWRWNGVCVSCGTITMNCPLPQGFRDVPDERESING